MASLGASLQRSIVKRFVEHFDAIANALTSLHCQFQADHKFGNPAEFTRNRSIPPHNASTRFDHHYPPTNFTIFTNFPLEIRCLIWKTTCRPRTVGLVYDEDDPEGFCSRAPYPLALQVCQESRDAIILSYPLCFGSIFFPPKVRFKFDPDTLFIDNELEANLPHLFSTFRDAEIKGLKYLALDEYYIFDYRLDDDKLGEALKRAIKSLKSLKDTQLVFDVESMASMALGCGEGHEKILYDEFPEELSGVSHNTLPTMEQIKDGSSLI